MTKIAMDIINRLKLTPLDGEGGYFRFLHEFGEGSGSIYYLVTDDSFPTFTPFPLMNCGFF